jgi:hypothetical protein
MKDIDFDELDKAVNSLMGSAQAPKEPSDAAPVTVSAPVITQPDPAPVPPITPETSPEPVEAVPAPVSPAVSSPRPAAPAQRRGGRFMDMVHASSDMKGRSPQPASREGITITPRNQPATETTPTPPQGSTSETWPDPLDLAQDANESTPPLEETAASPEVKASEPNAPTTATNEGAESPFLSDAKVEKRPLNPGTPAAEQVEDSSSETFDQPVVTTDADETPRPFVPAELNSDLVAIESAEPKTDMPDMVEQTAEADHAAPESKPTGPSSIAQQYREQPSSGDQSHASIYDASQFPAPLNHPAKKKSGWLWIVWVVLLLALGAGGAVALYLADII